MNEPTHLDSQSSHTVSPWIINRRTPQVEELEEATELVPPGEAHVVGSDYWFELGQQSRPWAGGKPWSSDPQRADWWPLGAASTRAQLQLRTNRTAAAAAADDDDDLDTLFIQYRNGAELQEDAYHLHAIDVCWCRLEAPVARVSAEGALALTVRRWGGGGGVPNGCLIEAPCLVNGGHGASLRQPFVVEQVHLVHGLPVQQGRARAAQLAPPLAPATDGVLRRQRALPLPAHAPQPHGAARRR
jgi:hypothetical protein